MKIGHPQQAIELGISYIPEERKSLGLFLDKSITENIVAARLQRGMYREKSNHLTAEALKQQLDIRTPSVRQQVRKLSGGNQQKVVLAKWLNTRPDVLIVNEPTHGVDVGAKAEIYQLLKKLTSAGKSILLISSELTEVLLLSDRIAVMHNGSIRDVLTRERATEEKITALASGL
jgi:ribose transport system ATP-binding protein